MICFFILVFLINHAGATLSSAAPVIRKEPRTRGSTVQTQRNFTPADDNHISHRTKVFGANPCRWSSVCPDSGLSARYSTGLRIRWLTAAAREDVTPRPTLPSVIAAYSMTPPSLRQRTRRQPCQPEPAGSPVPAGSVASVMCFHMCYAGLMECHEQLYSCNPLIHLGFVLEGGGGGDSRKERIEEKCVLICIFQC